MIFGLPQTVSGLSHTWLLSSTLLCSKKFFGSTYRVKVSSPIAIRSAATATALAAKESSGTYSDLSSIQQRTQTSILLLGGLLPNSPLLLLLPASFTPPFCDTIFCSSSLSFAFASRSFVPSLFVRCSIGHLVGFATVELAEILNTGDRFYNIQAVKLRMYNDTFFTLQMLCVKIWVQFLPFGETGSSSEFSRLPLRRRNGLAASLIPLILIA